MADEARRQLFFALKNDHGRTVVAKVQQQLRRQPMLAAVADSEGWLALHQAVFWQQGENALAIANALLSAYPQAARTAARDGRLPLHIAAASQGGDTGTALVAALLQAAPEAARMAMAGGSLPLHVAAQSQGGDKGAGVVQALLTAHPEAALCATTTASNLPLHVAAWNQGGAKGTAVAEILINAAPEALTKTNGYGETPLDMTLKRASSDFSQSGQAKLSASDPLIQLFKKHATPAPSDPSSVASSATAATATIRNTAAEANESRRAQLAAAVSSLAGTDGVPYNGVMAVSVGPGASGKTSLRFAIQGKPLPEQRQSTKGGEQQQLAVCINHGQMLDFVEVDRDASRVQLALLQKMLKGDAALGRGRPAEDLPKVVETADGYAAARIREQQLAEREKSIVAGDEAGVAPDDGPSTHIAAGHSAEPAQQADRNSSQARKETLVSSTSTSSPPAAAAVKAAPEQLHFSRDPEAVLSRLASLQDQGASEGVHLNFFDMGGQPEFAPLVAPFIRE